MGGFFYRPRWDGKTLLSKDAQLNSLKKKEKKNSGTTLALAQW